MVWNFFLILVIILWMLFKFGSWVWIIVGTLFGIILILFLVIGFYGILKSPKLSLKERIFSMACMIIPIILISFLLKGVFSITNHPANKFLNRSINKDDDSETDDITACLMAQQFIKQDLKAPSTAEFPSCDEMKIYQLDKNEFTVIGYVDAQNSFGAMLRTNFTIELQHVGKGAWRRVNKYDRDFKESYAELISNKQNTEFGQSSPHKAQIERNGELPKEIETGQLFVSGIFYDNNNPSAIIGEKIYHLGDNIDNLKIDKIEQDYVEFIDSSDNISRKKIGEFIEQ